MKPYAECKSTEYQWLGSIPAHWEWLFLSQTCRERDVKNRAKEESKVLSLSYGRIIRKRDINAGLVPKDYDTYQIVENGNIILRLTDLQNDQKSLRTGLVRERGIITSAYTCLVPFQNSEYLQLLLHAYDVQKYFYGLGGGVRQSIGFKDIRYTMVPVPPRDEQDKIVQWLDWRTSRINKLVRSKRHEIECLKELKQSVISKAVTVGLNPDTPKKVVKSYFERDVPEHWREANLKRILRKLNRTYGADAELLICSNKGTVFPRGDSKMGLVSDSDAFYQGVKSGDLLIHGMVTWHGAIAVSDLDGKCTGVVHVCDSKQNKRFVMYYLQMLAFRKLYKAITNGVRQNTSDYRSWDKAGSIEIVLPPKDEQDEIAKFLDEKCTAIERLIAKLHSEIDLVLEYKTRIISDAVTGKIDLRDVVVPDYDTVEDESVVSDDEDEVEEDTGDDEN